MVTRLCITTHRRVAPSDGENHGRRRLHQLITLWRMPGRYYQGSRRLRGYRRVAWGKDRERPILAASAQELLEGGCEELGSLGGPAAREVDLGAALGGVISRLEAGSDHETGRSRAHEETIAAILVGEAGDDDVEAGGVRLPDIGEAGLLTDHLEAHALPGLARRVLDVAEHGVAILRLVLGEGGRSDQAAQSHGEQDADVAARRAARHAHARPLGLVGRSERRVVRSI